MGQTERQDRQRSDSIHRTVLEAVAQKLVFIIPLSASTLSRNKTSHDNIVHNFAKC